MANERIRTIVVAGLLAVTGAMIAPGCANPGPIAARQNTVGSLKASVSQLEYDNINLRKQVAELRTESSRAEKKLVQAEDEIQRRESSVASVSRSSSSYSNPNSNGSETDDIPPPVQSPVHRSRGGRKPPAAQIPRITPRGADPGPGQIIRDQGTYDTGPQASRYINDNGWLPVARGNSRGGSVEVR